MSKFIALVLGIAGGVIGSQAPGFTLQYMQNLAGRVDQLEQLVQEFDESVGRYGFTRQQALGECAVADGLLDALCDGYEKTVRDYLDLSEHLAELRAAPDLKRPLTLAMDHRPQIVESVTQEFKPAVPTTIDGAVYAGGGMAVLWGGFTGLWALISVPFRRRSAA